MEEPAESLFCADCQMDFGNLTNFKKHLRKRHPTKMQQIFLAKENDPKFLCDNCGKSFNSSRGLACHKRSCSTDLLEVKPLVVRVQEKTKTKSILDDENIACSDCELEFEDLVTFKKHMRDHRDNKLKRKKSVKKDSVDDSQTNKGKRKRKSIEEAKPDLGEFNHDVKIEVVEESETPVRKSGRKRNRVSYAHLAGSDTDSENEPLSSQVTFSWRGSSKKQTCNECYMEYDDVKDLQKHVRKHHPSKLEKTSSKPDKSWKRVKVAKRKFTCETCSTNYNNISSLRKHIRKYHPTKWMELAPSLYGKRLKNKVRTYSCKKCGAKYGNIVGLRKHIRKYHMVKLEVSDQISNPTPFAKDEKDFTCTECQLKHSTLSSLGKHIENEHPSKLPELMPMLFKKKFTNFKRDIACSECEMMYSSMSGLRKHTRKHHPNELVQLAPLLYTSKRNMAKNILLKLRNLRDTNLEKLPEGEMLDMYKYMCNECDSSYSNISNLRKHLRRFHPDKLSDIAPLIKENKNFKYPCELCPKKFNCNRNFKYHQRKCHPEIAQPVTRTTKPTKINKCPLCFFQHMERKKLLQHFKVEHDIEVSMSPVEISTLEEFLKWKDTFEKESNTRFVKEYHFSCMTHDVVSYICHRSGYYNPKGKGLRHMKAQGSSKINGYCPAAMKLKKLKDDSVKVTFCGTHIGHTTDVSHLHLTPAERQSIAEQIAMNIPFNKILENMRDSASESDFKRIHMLSKKDLYNIKSSFHLNSPAAKSLKPQTENIGFEVWIEDMKQNGDCIMFHKPQGQCLPEHPNLKSDDFILMIMNQTQREKLRKFGQNTVCLDRSVDVNSQHFELTSLLVLNETDEGFPCAFLVSNRSDKEILTLFFHYIKTNVGGIDTKVFMSDMADYFYAAWISIMPNTLLTYRYYCTWQIEHSWRGKLSSLKSKDKQESIMNQLKEVLNERDISSFKFKLRTTAQLLSEEPVCWVFSNYLMNQFLDKEDIWPNNMDTFVEIKFNSHLERMHKTLKHLFLNGKNAKHFGKALGDTMRFIKDKLFDRTILINRGKINNKMKIAIFRHKLSLHSETDLISRAEEGWQIPCTESAEVYTITEIQPSCRCEFICPECKSCVHRYLCSCLDSSIKWNMCKHIHLLCRYLNSPENAKLQAESLESKPYREEYPNLSGNTHQVIYLNKPQDIEYAAKHADQVVRYIKEAEQVEYIKQPMEYIKQQPATIEYIKQQPQQIEFIKQHPQQVEHVQVQHIQVENHVGHVDQVESAYIYCNETNQREMDAILAEVNICNIETVQVTQIPTTCTIQIPTSCTVVPQVQQLSAGCTNNYVEVVDTKESLKMKFLKLLEDASSPSELEIVQKMLASITPTLEVIKGNSTNHQVLFPL